MRGILVYALALGKTLRAASPPEPLGWREQRGNASFAAHGHHERARGASPNAGVGVGKQRGPPRGDP
jgi:hypothetical protein